jgi:hypothetical protein
MLQFRDLEMWRHRVAAPKALRSIQSLTSCADTTAWLELASPGRVPDFLISTVSMENANIKTTTSSAPENGKAAAIFKVNTATEPASAPQTSANPETAI